MAKNLWIRNGDEFAVNVWLETNQRDVGIPNIRDRVIEAKQEKPIQDGRAKNDECNYSAESCDPLSRPFGRAFPNCSANAENHGVRANDLQANEKTDHPYSSAFYGSSAADAWGTTEPKLGCNAEGKWNNPISPTNTRTNLNYTEYAAHVRPLAVIAIGPKVCVIVTDCPFGIWTVIV
ncbi:hypothetical protein [Rubripirellula lacrimiformis]|uniref:hypothetical protein n=1 Tax=Rubripirellula lacrimiformis TaxID=1930273 RepID=UPI0011AAF43F|nr:hypothetical protein [Rubripirellula lacrimiformis]